jgi:RimJ/RimL family protein N-acetyltransferase/uncharacterized glyoxalase superfamily protein PhnB
MGGVTDIAATGRRVLLTRPEPDDQNDYLDAVAMSRTLLHPWIDAPDTPERFAALLERARIPDFVPLLVRARDDRRLVGAINVSNIVRGPFLSAFLGYWAFAGGQGQGLMTDAMTTTIAHAFDVLGLHRLEANIQPANARSIALVQRCGFHYEGFSPSYLTVDGAWRDHNRYAITREDLDNSRQPRRPSPRTRPGYHTVTARLVVTDVAAQVTFLRAVFNASATVAADRPAEVRVGDSIVLVSAAGEREAVPAFLYVYVDDADDAHRRALQAGATSVEAPRDTPYGDRRAMVRDPFGNVYQLAHLRPA